MLSWLELSDTLISTVKEALQWKLHLVENVWVKIFSHIKYDNLQIANEK